MYLPHIATQTVCIYPEQPTSLSESSVQMVTVLSKDPLASLLPSQLHATEWTCKEFGEKTVRIPIATVALKISTLLGSRTHHAAKQFIRGCWGVFVNVYYISTRRGLCQG